MSYAVKIGTTQALWIDQADTPAGHVRYDGGMTETLVWGDDVQNLREPNVSEVLSATKAERIEADRTECRRRLIEYYGDALEQISRASGLYGATAQANHVTGVSAAIDASNIARNLINAATTVAEVEAVTVAWPVLT